MDVSIGILSGVGYLVVGIAVFVIMAAKFPNTDRGEPRADLGHMWWIALWPILLLVGLVGIVGYSFYFLGKRIEPLLLRCIHKLNPAIERWGR